MPGSSRNEASGNLPWSVTMRFGTVMVACVLLALSGGQSLTPRVALLCYLSGLVGMACYFCSELVADQHSCKQAAESCQANADRLARRPSW